MFELSEKEIDALVSQSVIPSKKYFGGAKPSGLLSLNSEDYIITILIMANMPYFIKVIMFAVEKFDCKCKVHIFNCV